MSQVHAKHTPPQRVGTEIKTSSAPLKELDRRLRRHGVSSLRELQAQGKARQAQQEL